MTVRVCKNFIGGNWEPGSDEFKLALIRERFNPATGAVVSRVQMSTPSDAERTVGVAHKAFRAWRNSSVEVRLEIMRNVLALAREREEQLAEVIRDEMGKPLWKLHNKASGEDELFGAAIGEVRKAIEVIEHGFLLAQNTDITRQALDIEKTGLDIIRRFEPLGIVVMITAFNFPMILPAWKAVYALLAGNVVVWKSAPETPATSVAFAKLFEDAGLPAGVLNLLHGDANVGKKLVLDERVDMISFTGSTWVGNDIARLVYTKRVRTPHLLCELGGKNAAIVMPDADLSLVAKHSASAAAWSAGMRCTALSRLIVHKDIIEETLDAVVREMRDVPVGLPTTAHIQMGPLVSEEHMNNVLQHIACAVREGARLVTGGVRITTGKLAKGWYVEPTVLADVKPGMQIAREEVFGPVLSIIVVDSFDEAIDVLNNTRFGLKGGIYTLDERRQKRFIREARVGGVHINDAVAGAYAAMPFGGAPNTSTAIGPQECGPDAIRVYQRSVAVVKNVGGVSQDVAR